MGRTVAPVGDRRVIIDPDRIDGAAREQRIEGKAHLVAAVQHMGAVFGPVGRIDDLRRGAQDRAHILRKLPQPRDRGIDAGCGAHAGEADEFAA